MSDYDLDYWSVPFRGQFVRAVLAYAGKTWTEKGDAAVSDLMRGSVQNMPIPFMGPPLLVDHAARVAIAQMPAIVLYLGETLRLLPEGAAPRALTMKIVHDANDVIDDITQDGGRVMWTQTRWHEFRPRLEKWMSIWEETGRRHDLKAKSGLILGGDVPGIADIVTATLWSTLTARFDAIDAMLRKTAPAIAGLTQRVADLPPLKDLSARACEEYGNSYCGGKIEASLRKALKT